MKALNITLTRAHWNLWLNEEALLSWQINLVLSTILLSLKLTYLFKVGTALVDGTGYTVLGDLTREYFCYYIALWQWFINYIISYKTIFNMGAKIFIVLRTLPRLIILKQQINLWITWAASLCRRMLGEQNQLCPLTVCGYWGARYYLRWWFRWFQLWSLMFRFSHTFLATANVGRPTSLGNPGNSYLWWQIPRLKICHLEECFLPFVAILLYTNQDGG